MDSTALRALYEDREDGRWQVTTTATLAGRVCRELVLIPDGPEFGREPANWQRFALVPVVRVHVMVRKWRAIESEAGKSAYLDNWTHKYSPAFGGGEPD